MPPQYGTTCSLLLNETCCVASFEDFLYRKY